MKKGRLQKIISAGLVLTMLVGLTACGKKKEVDPKDDPNAALAKQYVFSEQAIEMPDLGDDFSIRMLKKSGEKIYALVDIYHWDEMTGSSDNEMKIVSWNMDGTGVQMVDMQRTLGGVEENETEEPTEETPADAPAAEDPNGDMIMDDMSLDYSDKYEYTGFNQLTITEDGKMYGIKEHYLEDYTDPENPIAENSLSVCSWTLDGVMQWETPVEGLQTDESWSYIQSIVPTAEGKLMMLISGDKQEMIEVSADGTLSERKELTGNSSILANTSNIMAKEDGTLLVIYWDENDNYNLKAASYDIKSDTMSEGVKLPDYFNMYGFNSVSEGIGSDMVFASSNGVYSYSIGDEQPTQIMSYINSDMATTNMNYIVMLDETHLMGFYYDNAENKNVGSIFTKVNPEDIPDKHILVLAGFYIDYATKNRVVDFNKSNEKYRVVVKEYQQYSTADDYMAGYAQLNNDIIAGGMPDILMVDNSVNVESYIAKGLLADIGALIEKDEVLSQKEFMENVFDAYKVNDKLYYVIPSFYVRTMIGKTSVVGDRNAWTMQDMMALDAELPDETQMIGDLTQSGFFYTMMQYCGNDFIDMTTGKCSFDSQGFIDLLNYAASLPTEFGEDYWGEDYWMKYESQYREDRTVLMDCYISNARDMNRNINGYFGEDISYIGFPTESGNGSVVAGEQLYALSAKSQNMDGAWEFVRYYLEDEYQSEIYSFPVAKDAFMNKVNEAMEKPYYLDENGEKVEYEDYFYMNGESIELPNMSQEQADEFVSFIESVNKKAYYNEQIQNIITEESAAFFEGQKSAQDVVAIIQSRAQIYVNENM